MWDRDRSTENDDRLRRDNQLFSHPHLTQEFVRQMVSTTQNKTDKSIYGDVLESVSLVQQKLGLEQALNVSDFPELKEPDQRKSLDLFTDTCKDMTKAGESTVEKAKTL
jgi:inhibitor of KinA sporulation pathway (predicted exonuclease)